MNKIYRLVWSKIRNCYVVACEYAKRHSKVSIRSYSLLALVVSLTLLNNPVLAAGTESHYVSINSTSTSSGSNYNNDGASGANAIAIGQQATATAKNAVAIGYKAKAEGEGAFAFGEGAISKGKGTVAFIGGNEAYGTYSMAWGMNNIAGISVDGTETYIGATAFGTGTEARNSGATAMGNWSIAEGQNSVAMGNESHTHADAKASLAMGQETHTLGTGSFAGGTDSIAGGFNSFAHGYTAEAVGSTAIAMGDDAKAIGDESVALGYNSKAFGDYSVAVLGGRTGNGTFSYDEDFEMYDVDVTDNAIGAIAAGYGSVAMKDYTVALGRHATVNNEKGIALGEDALVSADESSALGYGSVATEENVISVGHKQGDPTYNGGTYSSALTRKIVNVADGVDDTDAVNVSQLNTSLVDKANVDLDNITGAGKNVIKTNAKEAINVVGSDKAVVTKTDVSGVDTYTVSVTSDGAVASGDTDIVTGGTVYNALQIEARPAADGNYITTANTAGANLTALDTAVKANEDAIADLGNGKANVALDNITDDGKSVIKTNAKEAVNVTGSGNVTVTKTDMSGVDTYMVDVTATGQVADGDTNIVTGGTVRTALLDETRPASDGNYIAQSGTAGANLITLDTAVKTNADAIDALDTNKANISLDNITDAGKTVIQNATNVVSGDDIINVTSATADGVKTYTVTANISADGQIVSGNTGLVSGGTVFDETRSSDGNYISKTNTAGENISALDDALKDVSDTVDETKEALDGKANTGLDNITPAGERVIKDLAKGSVTVKSGEYTNIVKLDEAGMDTYTVNTVVNGAVASGNTGIVTGGTVYDAIQNVVSDTSDALDTKVNVSLDNLNTDGNRYLQQKAIQSVKVVDGKNTTVTSSYDADGNISYAVKVVADGEIAQGNGRLVTGGTVYDALKSQSDTITEELNKKANADASNVTDAQAWGEKIATGEIASGDVRAVSGDTVNALKTSVEEGLDNKANTSLDNITDNGKNVVRDLVKESISVVGDDDVVVTKQTAGNADESSLSIRKNGTVASGDEALITGSTMFTELRPSDGNYVRNSYTTAGNLMTLDAKLKETYDIAVAAGQTGTDENAVHYDSADKSVVTMAGADGTKLTNLKDGEISQNSKDAVTGGQLYQVKQDVAANTQAIDTLSDKVGDTADGTYVQSVNSVGQNLNALDNQVKSNTDAISSLTESMNGKVDTDLSNLSDAGKDNVKNIAKESVEVVSSDNSVSVTKMDTDTLRTFDLSVNKDGKVEEGNNGIVTGGTVYNAIQDIQVVVDDVEEKLDGKMNKDMSNLTEEGKDVIKEAVKPELDKKANTDASNIDVNAWSDKLGIGEVAEGDNGLVKGDTVYQALQDVKDGAVSVEGDTIRIGGKAKYDNVDKVSVAKSDGSGRVITGVVTDVSDDTSAANVGYVKAVGETIIDGVNAGLHKMDNKINKVGAGAAALASIAPMPFDEDRKWTVAAAIGTYKGEQAGAIGAFYKPQENIMFNVRGVIGNGENMAGAGITIGLDKGPAKGLSKVAMAKVINTQAQEIQAQKAQLDAQKAELEAQEAEIQQLKEMVQKIVSK